MPTVNELQTRAYQHAVDKNFRGVNATPRTFGDDIALIMTELAEAFEEFRNGHKPCEIYFTHADSPTHGTLTKPEGIPIELADVFIRLLDMCEHYSIDLENATLMKMTFNDKRPSKHGGKVI